ncbi:PolC-type DNA polymerase III [Anaerobacillus sp. MEB173]|uniref:3'-5' exonuclease n=1 Tax=Anaerobacillus sp. MEB173 TaxID=3383345 RepID=UPI003F91F6D6
MFWKRKRLHYQLDVQPPLSTPIEELSFTVFDTETTGFAIGGKDRVIEIGAVHVSQLEVTETTFQTFVNPYRDIPANITELTGIEQHDVDGAPSALEAIENFFQFIEDTGSCGWVGHYLSFDVMVIKRELQREKYTFEQPLYFDTLDLIGYLNPSWDMRDLEKYACAFGTRIYDRHRALGDALTTAHLFCELLKHTKDRGKNTLGELIEILDTENRTRVLSF